MSWKDDFPKQNRYFETKNGILYLGDSQEIMKDIPPESIDLILTDPPFNIADSNKLTRVGGKIATTKEAWGDKFKDKWDTEDEYFDWLLEIIRLLHNSLAPHGSMILFLGRKYTGYMAYNIEKLFGMKYRNKLYFEKLNPLPHVRKNNYRSCMEEAIWLTKPNKYYIDFLSQEEMCQVFKGYIGQKETIHPTEKYPWMIIPIIRRHSKPDDLILDSFVGSGSIPVIAEKLGRRWIGIEINPEYCKVTKERLNNIQATFFD